MSGLWQQTQICVRTVFSCVRVVFSCVWTVFGTQICVCLFFYLLNYFSEHRSVSRHRSVCLDRVRTQLDTVRTQLNTARTQLNTVRTQICVRANCFIFFLNTVRTLVSVSGHSHTVSVSRPLATVFIKKKVFRCH